MLLIIQVAYNIIAPILLVTGVGYGFKRWFAPDGRTLSRAAFYILSPALVMRGIADSTLQAGEMGRILALVLLLALVLILLGTGLARLFRLDRGLETAFVLSVLFMNAGNYGLPLNEFAFGAAGLERAIIFFVGSSLVQSILGVFIASRGAASLSRSIVNVLVVPLPWAALVGFVVNQGYLQLPLAVDRAIELLSDAAVPVMLLNLGFQLSRTGLRGRSSPLLLATLARLLVSPLIALLLATLFGLSGLTRQVIVVQAAMPTAVITTIVAAEYGSDTGFTSGGGACQHPGERCDPHPPAHSDLVSSPSVEACPRRCGRGLASGSPSPGIDLCARAARAPYRRSVGKRTPVSCSQIARNSSWSAVSSASGR